MVKENCKRLLTVKVRGRARRCAGWPEERRDKLIVLVEIEGWDVVVLRGNRKHRIRLGNERLHQPDQVRGQHKSKHARRDEEYSFGSFTSSILDAHTKYYLVYISPLVSNEKSSLVERRTSTESRLIR